MIDPNKFSMSLGNMVATRVLIEDVNKEFQELRNMIAALQELVEKQAAPQAKKATK